MSWYVYIASCRDGSLYAGITTDINRREEEHNTDNTKGAKSLRGKRPIEIVYCEEYDSQGEARSRETEIKGWKRPYKLKLINEGI